MPADGNASEMPVLRAAASKSFESCASSITAPWHRQRRKEYSGLRTPRHALVDALHESDTTPHAIIGIDQPSLNTTAFAHPMRVINFVDMQFVADRNQSIDVGARLFLLGGDRAIRVPDRRLFDSGFVAVGVNSCFLGSTHFSIAADESRNGSTGNCKQERSDDRFCVCHGEPQLAPPSQPSNACAAAIRGVPPLCGRQNVRQFVWAAYDRKSLPRARSLHGVVGSGLKSSRVSLKIRGSFDFRLPSRDKGQDDCQSARTDRKHEHKNSMVTTVRIPTIPQTTSEICNT